jgi:plasmid stabilization system protein ParE
VKFTVEYTFNAQTELEEAYEWIRERAPIAAQKWLEELIAKIEKLADNPKAHPPAPESGRFQREIRLMPFRKRRSQFRIYYSVERARIVILSVRRSFRKPLEEDDLSL